MPVSKVLSITEKAKKSGDGTYFELSLEGEKYPKPIFSMLFNEAGEPMKAGDILTYTIEPSKDGKYQNVKPISFERGTGTPQHPPTQCPSAPFDVSQPGPQRATQISILLSYVVDMVNNGTCPGSYNAMTEKLHQLDSLHISTVNRFVVEGKEPF